MPILGHPMSYHLEIQNIKVVYMFTQYKFGIQFPKEIEWDVSIPMRVFIEYHVLVSRPVVFNICFYAPVYINV